VVDLFDRDRVGLGMEIGREEFEAERLRARHEDDVQ
jgi:hypothetical protein